MRRRERFNLKWDLEKILGGPPPAGNVCFSSGSMLCSKLGLKIWILFDFEMVYHGVKACHQDSVQS